MVVREGSLHLRAMQPWPHSPFPENAKWTQQSLLVLSIAVFQSFGDNHRHLPTFLPVLFTLPEMLSLFIPNSAQFLLNYFKIQLKSSTSVVWLISPKFQCPLPLNLPFFLKTCPLMPWVIVYISYVHILSFSIIFLIELPTVPEMCH